jgi:alkaline phosphatase
MGFEQVKAASYYKYGIKGNLSFEHFTIKGNVTTYSADNKVTDSAAAATAISTGVKVKNKAISFGSEGEELTTILEMYKGCSKNTGLVTSAFITHATPASFAAHEENRNSYKKIPKDYFSQTKPDLIFGGGHGGINVEEAENAGYTLITDRESFEKLDTESAQATLAIFGKNHMPYEFDDNSEYPHLSEMAIKALNILDNNDGFFLMIESGRIDHAGHDKKIERNIFETIEFSKTVDAILEWAKDNPQTLIIVTADHETGGLIVKNNKGKGEFPDIEWSSGGGHTASDVPIYSWGIGAEVFEGTLDNTDIFKRIVNLTNIADCSP